MSTILWIDPGTTTIWYAIVNKEWNNIKMLDYWIIETTPKIELKYKLLEIGRDIWELIDNYKPELVSIEKLYFTNNIKTWIDVSHARWVIVYEAIKRNLEILEYTPLELKQWICGFWKADKKQMQNAIKIIMKLDSIPKPDDAADALCLAYIWALNKKIV